MKLLLSFSSNPEEFKWWYLAEVVLILLNYAICIGSSCMVPKLRFHVHFKISALFVFSQYFIFLTARLIVLGYQSQLLLFDGTVDKNFLIVACSWIRIYFIVMLQIIAIPLVVERELALYFIQDYANETRIWIPGLVIFIFVSISSISATVVVLDWIHILFGYYLIFCVPGIFFPLFILNYRKTWLLNNAVKKKRPSKIKYTLAVRYQLEENLFFAENLVFVSFVILLTNATTSIVFVLSQLTIFSPETMDLLLRLFHLLIAVDGPIITFGLFVHNAYFKKVAKEMLCGVPVDVVIDNGDSYFEQLEIQWEELTEKKRQKDRQKTFLMWLLWLYDE